MTKDTIGARLKKLRLEKGLTLEEVQKKTKIHLSILKSIEEDSLINLNPVYLKGFLKIYCRLLGLDPRVIIPDYREVKTKVELKSKTPIKIKNPVSFLRFIPRIRIKPLLISLVVIITIFGLFNFIKFISHRYGKAASVKEQQPQIVDSVKAQVPSSSGIKLGIRAKENCYINLKTDGKTVFYGILKKGRAENWQAKERIEFSLGNAGVVDLQVNGKMISSLGKKGQALKNITVTKEGLNVKR